jgi:outer membrane protein, multidrug efflux system
MGRRWRTLRRALGVVAAGAALVAGCTVGPDYRRPDVATPPAWRIDTPQAAEIVNIRWWEQFGDPVLNQPTSSSAR